MSSQHMCPFCSSPLLCQIRGGTLSWYCRHCHVDIPYGIANDFPENNLVDGSITLKFSESPQQLLVKTLEKTVQEIKEALNTDRVMLWKHSNNGELKVLIEALNQDYPSMKDWRVGHFFTNQDLDEFKQGKLQISENQENLLESFFKVKAKLLAPVIIKQDNDHPKLWGLLIAHNCANQRQWQDSEIKLVVLIAKQIAREIEQAESYQQLKLAYQKLEKNTSLAEVAQLSPSSKLEAYLDQEWQKMYQLHQPLSIVICAVDALDKYGHIFLNYLKGVAQVINNNCQSQESLIVKNEAKELVIILPGIDGAGAVQLAEKIRVQVKKMPTENEEAVTVSLGIASTIPEKKVKPNTLLEKAAWSLVQAQKAGGDRLNFHNHQLRVFEFKSNPWEKLSSTEQLMGYVAYFISRGKIIISAKSGPLYFKGLVYEYQGYHQDFLGFWRQLNLRRDFLDLYLQGDRYSFQNFLDGSLSVGECARCNILISNPVGAAYDIPHCDSCNDYQHTESLVRVMAIAQSLTQIPHLQRLCAKNRILLTCISTPNSLRTNLGVETIDLIVIDSQISPNLAQTWVQQLHQVPALEKVPIIALSKQAGNGIVSLDSEKELANYVLNPLNGKHLADYLRELAANRKSQLNWFPG
ncbi:diguanylate cyclase domain-containing protein [Gloeocapsa sp. PCC 73106]|uniref:sensor domain-containing diguanylate cyclase n=1 Tax=Gloeocapsa sp. PCC 73106 TaxID=102232 RepID=UPI0002AC6444|nr:diguanylate cyclase [Gloeocapsa sp. PCC 73106]ELR96331.1 diguanylate cyclase (GGDEF) domain-containing protein [Gloeocapsa sp. PCC 73106]